MPDYKKLGCCTVCDVPIFEIVSRHMDGPFKSEAKLLGMPLPGARRIYIVRISGHQSFWSVCRECDVTPSDLPILNRKELASMVREKLISNDDSRQAAYRDTMLRLFQFDVPLGILGERTWVEIP
jgi:hypothetical protein